MLSYPSPIEVNTQTSTPSLKINWVQYSNPTTESDSAQGVCVYGDYVYVVGHSATHPRIEMRRKSDGVLVKSWSGDLYDVLHECLIVNDRLLALGAYHFYVFDTSLNLKEIIPRHNVSLSWRSFLFDGTYIYAAGIVRDVTGGDDVWLIGIFNPKNLSKPLKIITINPTPYLDDVSRIGLNPVTKQLWVIGDTGVPESNNTYRPTFRVEIIDKDLNSIKSMWLTKYYEAIDIVFDEYGYAYVLTSSYVLKFNKYGNLIKEKHLDIFSRKLAYWNGYIVIAGEDFVDGYVGQVIQLLDRDLNILDELVLSGNVSAGFEFLGRIVVDGNNLYVAGYDCAENATRPGRWVIYSISLGEYASAPTQTAFITYTTTVTRTVTTVRTVTTTYTSFIPTTITSTYTITYTAAVPITYTKTIKETATKVLPVTRTVTTTLPRATETITVTRTFTATTTSVSTVTISMGSSSKLPSWETMVLSGAVLLIGFIVAVIVSKSKR